MTRKFLTAAELSGITEAVLAERPLIRRNIWKAAAKGDLDDLKHHLRAGADPDDLDKKGWSPLHYAAAAGQQDTAETLSKAGAWINRPTAGGSRPVELAIRNGHDELANYFIGGLGARLDTKNLMRMLHDALSDPDSAALRRLLCFGVAAEPLEHATAGNYTADDIRELYAPHSTPLHLAVARGYYEHAKALLDYGAHHSPQHSAIAEPLWLAIEQGRPDLIRLLMAAGAGCDRAKLWNRMLSAVRHNNLLPAAGCLEAGANVNAEAEHGQTLLHIAAFRRLPEMAALLIKHGADRNAHDDFGDRPVDIVNRKWRDRKMRKLLAADAA